MSKQEKINLIAFVLLLGFCLAFYFSFIVFDLYLGKYYWSKASIFFDPNDKFNDFKNALLNQNVVNFEPYSLNGKAIINNYFPFTYILFYPLVFLSENQGLALFFFTTTLGLLYANWHFLNHDKAIKIELIQNLFIFTFLTFPFLFTIDRANIEGWILLIYIGFFIAYDKKKFNLAAIIIGIGAAIKFYPGMFAFFLLKDKKYREFLLFVFFTLLITFLSLSLFKGGFLENFHNLSFNLKVSEIAFAIGFMEPVNSWADLVNVSIKQIETNPQMHDLISYSSGTKNSSSLFASLKILIIALGIENYISTNLLLFYYKIAALLLGCALFLYLLKYENEKWKIAFFLAAYFILFIHSSFHYKLLAFFPAIWLYVNSAGKARYDYLYCICLALLMIPKHYLFLMREISFDFADIINPLLIIIICALFLIEKLQQKFSRTTANYA